MHYSNLKQTVKETRIFTFWLLRVVEKIDGKCVWLSNRGCVTTLISAKWQPVSVFTLGYRQPEFTLSHDYATVFMCWDHTSGCLIALALTQVIANQPENYKIQYYIIYTM